MCVLCIMYHLYLCNICRVGDDCNKIFYYIYVLQVDMEASLSDIPEKLGPQQTHMSNDELALNFRMANVTSSTIVRYVRSPNQGHGRRVGAPGQTTDEDYSYLSTCFLLNFYYIFQKVVS